MDVGDFRDIAGDASWREGYWRVEGGVGNAEFWVVKSSMRQWMRGALDGVEDIVSWTTARREERKIDSKTYLDCESVGESHCV